MCALCLFTWLQMLSTNFTVRISARHYFVALYYMCKEMYDSWRGIEGFAIVRRPWRAIFLGEVHVTNETGQLLEIQLSPLNNQRLLARRRIDANISASVGGAGVGGVHEESYEEATNAERVHRSALGHGMTAHLQSHKTKAYLTVTAYLPPSGSQPASGGTFKLVENALVSRWREYVFELKHFQVALALHEKQA